MINKSKRISELPSLSGASLDTTFVVGISGSTTYKISINNLTSSLDGAFATDLVTNALSSSLNSKLSTSSFNSYTSSFTASVATGTISGSQQISDLGFISGSYETTGRGIISSSANLVTTSSFNSYTASISTASLVTSISNLNSFTASQSTASLVTSISNLNTTTSSLNISVNALNTATSSYETKGRSIVSGSSQLTSSFDTRYAISASFVSSSNVASIQTITSASYAALTPVSGTLYIIIG